MREDLPFNLLIREARLALGLTLIDVSASVGITRNTLWRWEHGAPLSTVSRVERLETLATVLQLQTTLSPENRRRRLTPLSLHCKRNKHLFVPGSYSTRKKQDGTYTRICKACRNENNKRKYVEKRRDSCKNGHPYPYTSDKTTRRFCYICRDLGGWQPRGPGERCRRGHVFTDDNVFIKGGVRTCRLCALAWTAERRGDNDLAAKLRRSSATVPPRRGPKIPNAAVTP